MAKSAGPSKPAKPTRAEKKAGRALKRQSRRETWANMRQAFTLTRQRDKRFIPYLTLAAVGAAAVVYVVLWLVLGKIVTPIPLAIVAGLVAAMLVFSRRAQRTMYSQAEGQLGSAGYVLQQQLRGDWRLTQAVAGTAQLDAVHRLVGRPGIVLVGEGAPHRVRGLLAQEKKRVSRISGDTPIYDLTVGTAEGDVRLSRLNRYLLKLPHNLTKDQISTLDKRLAALGGTRQQLPQGPLPQGAKVRNVQRAARRRS